MMKFLVAVAVAGAMLTGALVGCSSSDHDSSGNEMPDIVKPHYVQLPDHRTVLCVWEKSGYGGGPSCDWRNAK